MRLDGPESSNLEDRRGGGGGGGPKLVVGGLGGVVLVIGAIVLGIDPSFLIQDQGAISTPTNSAGKTSPEDDRKAKFVSKVLASTEEAWTKVFKEQLNKRYKKPKLVLFTGSTPTACGKGAAAMGPFYCPADQKGYLDLSFFAELERRFKAPGDFAQAYVIAHEVGHHVQTITGVSARVHKQKRGLSKAAANELSVRQELQADCYSGIWAHHADKMRGIIEKGDVEEALRAATAIGDDAIQKRSQGYVVPDSFTHGSSKQRVKWFKVGLKHGSMDKCDTFKVSSL